MSWNKNKSGRVQQFMQNSTPTPIPTPTPPELRPDTPTPPVQDLSLRYNKINSYSTTMVGFWEHNNGRNSGTIRSSTSLENFVETMTVNFDFTIDGIAYTHQNQIADTIECLWESEPGVKYSPVSEYIHPGVIQHNSSVTHCQTNIMRHRLSQYHDLSTCSTVLEIGAGYGAFAREILLTNDKMKYVIIDLPEGLMASWSFLSLEFPDKKHIMVGIDEDIDDFDVLYIPTGKLDSTIKYLQTIQFDLFVNTCSMGEMLNPVIEKYYDLITNELSVKSMYWLNRAFNSFFNKRELSNGCMGLIPKTWHIKQWTNMPKFLSACPNIMSSHAKMAEIYATIENSPDVLKNTKSNPDKLFQLWNRARLYPSPENYTKFVDGMKLKFPEAEEIRFYENK